MLMAHPKGVPMLAVPLADIAEVPELSVNSGVSLRGSGVFLVLLVRRVRPRLSTSVGTFACQLCTTP